MRRLVTGAVLLAALVPSAVAQDSLVGKPLPELELKDYMLQGRRLTQADFKGKVVFLELFQLGCPGCWRHSLPHLQKLYSKYKDDPSVVVLAINTAFEKDRYPVMAHEDRTKEQLARFGYEFPVARDRDEKSVRLFRRSYRGRVTFGTPMGVVVGPDGKVLAHEFTGNAAATTRMTTVFEKALATLRLPVLREVDAALAPAVAKLQAQDWGSAWALAGAVASRADATEAQQVDAGYLREQMTAHVRAQTTAACALRERDVLRALDRAEVLLERYAGVPEIKAFAAKVLAWQADENVSILMTAQAALASVEDALKRADHFVSKTAAEHHVETLKGVTRDAGEHPMGRRAAALRAQLEKALARPGYMGMSTRDVSRGLLVRGVTPTGPAARAGIRMGDRLVSAGGTPVNSFEALKKWLDTTKPGDSATLVIERGDQKVEVKLVLGVWR